MDFKDIKELIRVFDKSELNKLRVKEGEFEISMQRGFEGGVTTVSTTPMVQAVAPATQNASTSSSVLSTPAVSNEAPKENGASGITINAPMVGIYYYSPSPDSPSFYFIGNIVRKGQTLSMLEAIKIIPENEDAVDCTILAIVLQNGEPVEYDMPINI